MAKSKQEIIADINSFIKKGGGGYRAWYVGITSGAKARLAEHKAKVWWIFKTAISSQVAREIEDHFVNSCKTDGGTGGGDETATKVYAYKKAPHTDP